MGRKSVAGSTIGGIAETQELIDFCGHHHILGMRTKGIQLLCSSQDTKIFNRKLPLSNVESEIISSHYRSYSSCYKGNNSFESN
jgi:hypothetical protein